MDCYRLSEHSRLEVTQLHPDDVLHLQRNHAGHVTLTPGPGNTWLLQSNHHVGTIKLPSGSHIYISPKVPVNNLLYMVAHTYDLVHFKDLSQHEQQEEGDIADVYVHVLLSWLEILIRKGLYKSYISTVESIPAIKGKYLIGQNLTSTTRFWCEYDELTFSTQVNRILKSTVLHIIRKVPVSQALHQQALTYFRLMHPIEEIALSPKVFRQVEYNRLNHQYQTLIELCALIYTNSSLLDGDGGQAFSGFMANMNRIFERFILKVLQKAFPDEYISGGRVSDWAVPLQDDNYLPEIKPDIHIRGRYLIDTKYYQSPVNGRGKLHSAHLYQMLAYMQSYDLDGMLLYPEAGERFEHQYQVGGHILSVMTINLGSGVLDFSSEIGRLVDGVKRWWRRSN